MSRGRLPDVKDLKITRDNGSWKVEANYDDQAPLFANVFILVTFDKTVTLKRRRQRVEALAQTRRRSGQ